MDMRKILLSQRVFGALTKLCRELRELLASAPRDAQSGNCWNVHAGPGAGSTIPEDPFHDFMMGTLSPYPDPHPHLQPHREGWDGEGWDEGLAFPACPGIPGNSGLIQGSAAVDKQSCEWPLCCHSVFP